MNERLNNVYSEHCTQNIANDNKTQYKQANLTAILQAMMFERGKFEGIGFCVNLPNTYLYNGYNNLYSVIEYRFIFKS